MIREEQRETVDGRVGSASTAHRRFERATASKRGDQVTPAPR
jgi:hypothetical protein